MGDGKGFFDKPEKTPRKRPAESGLEEAHPPHDESLEKTRRIVAPRTPDSTPPETPPASGQTRLKTTRKKKPRKRRSWGKRFLILTWWGIEAAIALAIGVFIFDRVVMPQVVRYQQEVVIPEVAGLEMDQAEARIKGAGLQAAPGPGKYSPLIPRGLALEASPVSGLSVKKGRKVFLTRSLGMENRRVPDLLGLSLRLATVRLQESGLKIGTTNYTATDKIPPGQVLAMTPPSVRQCRPRGRSRS